MRLVLTPGQAADVTQAEAPIEGVPFEVVIADRGYDSREVVEAVEAGGGEAVIPTQKDRKVQRVIDRERYKDRNPAERFWARVKQYRRVASALREDRPQLPGLGSCGIHYDPVAIARAAALAQTA